MKKFRKISAAVIALLCVFTITGCNNEKENDSKSESGSSQEISAETLSDLNTDPVLQTNSKYFDSDDLDSSYDNVDAEIALKGSTAEINGKGASLSGKRIEIENGGTYLFSGTLSNGQIHVNTKEKVHIVLNNVDISCSDSSPLFIEDSDNSVITVVGENTVSDSTEYDNAQENEPDAVIYSKDDLSINGSGTLNITANYNEGITSKNDLRISGVTLNIISSGNSIKGKDSLAFMNAAITAESMADGLKSSNTEETDKGYIAVESGNFNITAAQDAMQAETDLIINGGTFNIKTGTQTDTDKTETTESGNISNSFGRRGFIGEGNPDKTDQSEKGFKAGRSIQINDGDVTADCTDDTVHTNGSIQINGGTIKLSSGDDGIHADETIDVSGGNVNIEKSYEGIEAAVINVNDGNIYVKSTDDGFNASDGGDDDQIANDTSNPVQKGGFGDVSENCELNINGGYIYVNADGDGLDSNGVINMNSGIALVDGPVNDGNGALDCGTEVLVNGGTLIAAGSSGMAELPSDDSKQYSLAVSFGQSQNENSLIYVQNKSGENIIAYSPAKTFSSIVISTPDIAPNQTYSVYCGGSCTGTLKNGLYTDGECSGGTLIGNGETSSAVTQIGDGVLGMTGGGMGNKQHEHNRNKDFENGEIPEMPSNMTPPDGFDENMTPPGGFGDGMTPPEGFNENITPPNGLDRDMRGNDITRPDEQENDTM